MITDEQVEQAAIAAVTTTGWCDWYDMAEDTKDQIRAEIREALEVIQEPPPNFQDLMADIYNRISTDTLTGEQYHRGHRNGLRAYFLTITESIPVPPINHIARPLIDTTPDWDLGWAQGVRDAHHIARRLHNFLSTQEPKK